MSAFLEELEEILGPADTPEYAEARLALDIAVQFAALRERRGLTQRQAGELIGRTQQAISRIENPSHDGHNLARLKAILAALDATIDVTIVPLEDLPAYEELRSPKPTLEDIRSRIDVAREVTRANGRRRRPNAPLKASGPTAKTRHHRNGAADVRPHRKTEEVAANG